MPSGSKPRLPSPKVSPIRAAGSPLRPGASPPRGPPPAVKAAAAAAAAAATTAQQQRRSEAPSEASSTTPLAAPPTGGSGKKLAVPPLPKHRASPSPDRPSNTASPPGTAASKGVWPPPLPRSSPDRQQHSPQRALQPQSSMPEWGRSPDPTFSDLPTMSSSTFTPRPNPATAADLVVQDTLVSQSTGDADGPGFRPLDSAMASASSRRARQLPSPHRAASLHDILRRLEPTPQLNLGGGAVGGLGGGEETGAEAPPEHQARPPEHQARQTSPSPRREPSPKRTPSSRSFRPTGAGAIEDNTVVRVTVERSPDAGPALGATFSREPARWSRSPSRRSTHMTLTKLDSYPIGVQCGVPCHTNATQTDTPEPVATHDKLVIAEPDMMNACTSPDPADVRDWPVQTETATLCDASCDTAEIDLRSLIPQPMTSDAEAQVTPEVPRIFGNRFIDRGTNTAAAEKVKKVEQACGEAVYFQDACSGEPRASSQGAGVQVDPPTTTTGSDAVPSDVVAVGLQCTPDHRAASQDTSDGNGILMRSTEVQAQTTTANHSTDSADLPPDDGFRSSASPVLHRPRLPLGVDASTNATPEDDVNTSLLTCDSVVPSEYAPTPHPQQHSATPGSGLYSSGSRQLPVNSKVLVSALRALERAAKREASVHHSGHHGSSSYFAADPHTSQNVDTAGGPGGFKPRALSPPRRKSPVRFAMGGVASQPAVQEVAASATTLVPSPPRGPSPPRLVGGSRVK